MNSITKNISCHLNLNAAYSQISDSIPKKLLEKLMNLSERNSAFDPISTLYIFLIQIYESVSCKGKLSKFNLIRALLDLKPVSLNTGCYSRAKKKLCENLLQLKIKLYTHKAQDRK